MTEARDRTRSVAGLPPDLKAVHNERAKDTATWLDTAGASAVTVGVIAPLAALAFGHPSPPGPLARLVGSVASFFLAGVVLRLLARLVLGTPLMLVATGLGVVWLTGWMDARSGRTPAE